MLARPSLGIMGFLVSFAALLFFAPRGDSQLTLVSVVVLIAANWLVEYQTVKRRLCDFSCGFIFLMILGLSGQAILALWTLGTALAIRQMKAGRTSPWDLVWSVPALVLMVLGQSVHSPAEGGTLALGWGLAALVIQAGCYGFGSATIRRVARQKKVAWQDISIEKEQNRLRLLALFYCLMALALTPENCGIAALVLPLCLAVHKGANQLGFKVQAQAADLAIESAKESQRQLARVHGQLNKVSKKQRLLEDVVSVFERSLSPEGAFKELCRTTIEVVEYRSIVLFRLTQSGRLEPYRQLSPETDLLSKATLTLRTEPLVEKAWLHDRPYRGVASANQEQRLLPSEANLVAIPLKPFGVLYFGRDSGEPYTKAEASKLLFVTTRAESALVRAEEDAQSREALAEQTNRSQVLQQKVALSSRLLEVSQGLMSTSTPKELAQVLMESIATTVPDCAGSICISTEEQRLEWGPPGLLGDQEIEEPTRLVRESGRPLYLPKFSNSRLSSESTQLESLIVIPLLTEAAHYGYLFVGSPREQAFARDMHDFVCTLGCLGGVALESQQLNSELRAAHEQVVQASKMSAIGQLAAGVAHELNTPLAAISLAIEVASLESDRVADTLSGAEKALDRAQSIVSALLEHSRQKNSDRELVSVSALFEEVRQVMCPRLEKRHQSLQVSTEQRDELSLLANQAELEQVLNNLILNASDASPENSKIKLRGFRKGDSIILEITDEGVGIPEEIESKIFDPFFSTKDIGKGTGLGLSVCRELVHRHHGKISFQSDDHGTTFLLNFPARSSGRSSILQ